MLQVNDASQVLERIGRNLLVYQQLEHILRRVVPYIHPEGSARGVDALRQLQHQISRRTLGDVVQAFAEAIESDATDFSRELRALARARNDLVHRLLILPGVDILSEEGRRHTIQYLDAQFEAAQRMKNSTFPLYDFLQDALERMNKDASGKTGCDVPVPGSGRT